MSCPNACSKLDITLEELKSTAASPDNKFSSIYDQLRILIETAIHCSINSHRDHVECVTEAIDFVLDQRGKRADEIDLLKQLGKQDIDEIEEFWELLEESPYFKKATGESFILLCNYVSTAYYALHAPWDTKEHPYTSITEVNSSSLPQIRAKMEQVMTTGIWTGQGADEECPICMEPRDSDSNMAILDGCNHTFCNKCAETLFVRKRDMRCPYCRADMKQWTNTFFMNLRRVNHHQFTQ